MNKKYLMLFFIPLLLCVVIPSVSAAAQKWYHEVGKDTGSDTQEYVFPLDGSYPFTQLKWVSTYSWDNHWVADELLDAHGNMHLNMKYLNKGSVHGDMWAWNEITQEWVFVQTWLQTFRDISGYKSLFLISGMQTSKQLSVSRETYEANAFDPLTGEKTTYSYMFIIHSNVKWVNGELQFEHTWEIRRE